jgi:hypothetical protein
MHSGNSGRDTAARKRTRVADAFAGTWSILDEMLFPNCLKEMNAER